MKKNILFVILFSFIFTACKYKPQNGDLLFVVAESSDFENAITESTAWNDSIKFAHVAILAVKNEEPYIIEASTKKGVTKTKWEDFLQSAPKINGKPGIVAMRIKKKYDASKAIKLAEHHYGEPYDWTYFPNNEKMYCSELVYVSYLDNENNPLFTAKPMNFRDKNGVIPTFWTTLFEQLGEPIPQGIIGTNPNDMAKDSILTEVFRFF